MRVADRLRHLDDRVLPAPGHGRPGARMPRGAVRDPWLWWPPALVVAALTFALAYDPRPVRDVEGFAAAALAGIAAGSLATSVAAARPHWASTRARRALLGAGGVLALLPFALVLGALLGRR